MVTCLKGRGDRGARLLYEKVPHFGETEEEDSRCFSGTKGTVAPPTCMNGVKWKSKLSLRMVRGKTIVRHAERRNLNWNRIP